MLCFVAGMNPAGRLLPWDELGPVMARLILSCMAESTLMTADIDPAERALGKAGVTEGVFMAVGGKEEEVRMVVRRRRILGEGREGMSRVFGWCACDCKWW